MAFQLFGSASSQDYDVLVFVDKLDAIHANHDAVKAYNAELGQLFDGCGMPKREVNANLGVLVDGKITDVFKGTYDEVNNALLYTYDNHRQFHPQQITARYDRTETFYKQLKLKRCFRFLLSFYSRVPELRPVIKPALKGTFDVRLEALSNIDLTKHVEFPGKKELREDIYKVIAFQLAQTLCLYHHTEIYTKEAAVEYYPGIHNCIFRNSLTATDLEYLDKMLKILFLMVKY